MFYSFIEWVFGKNKEEEAKRIQSGKEQGFANYPYKNNDSIPFRTKPLDLKQIIEITYHSIRISNSDKLSNDIPILCIGRSPRWFAECFHLLNRKSIAFNYSGQGYVRQLQNSYSLYPISIAEVKEMRAYLTACGLDMKELFEQESIYLMDYISGGGALLSFVHFIAHWHDDQKTANNLVTSPLDWVKSEKAKQVVEELIPKIKFIGLSNAGCAGLGHNEQFQEQFRLLNKQIIMACPRSTYRYPITHNHDHTLGFNLPVTEWHHATDWLEYEQYPDREALKTLKQFKQVIDYYLERVDSIGNENEKEKIFKLFVKLIEEVKADTPYDQWSVELNKAIIQLQGEQEVISGKKRALESQKPKVEHAQNDDDTAAYQPTKTLKR